MKTNPKKQTSRFDYPAFLFAGFLAIALVVNSACTTTQEAQAQATVGDALDAGAVIAQAYVALKTPVPASALQTGNSSVDKYISTSTTVLNAPPTQALVNDLFKLAAKNPTTVPTNP